MMPSSSALYDRTNVISVIDRECPSASIVGTHKVGKTRILDHLEARNAPTADTAYCRVDPYTLRGFLAAGETLTDHTFLRLFLTQLLARVDVWVDELALTEGTCRAELAKTEQRLALGGLTPAEVPQFQRAADAFKRQLRTLECMRDVKDRTEKLVDEPKLQASRLALILNTLQKIGRRVVLLIDDFNEIVEEKDLSDELFSFLRGASSERKIFAIVCSPDRLMETKTRKPDLFNHLSPQLLEPFSRAEADGFLEWEGLAPATPPLNDGERAYLYQLGGGSPYFLELARREFLQRGRPATDAARSQFEKRYLAGNFDPGLRAIWSRCTAEQRTALRQLVVGQPADEDALADLEWKGYLVLDDDGRGRPFSTLFTEFIRRNPRESGISKPSAPPPVTTAALVSWLSVESVRVPYRVFPTALYLAAPDLAEPVAITLRNAGADQITAQLSCRVEQYSAETRKTVTLSPGQVDTVYLRLAFGGMPAVAAPVKAQIAYRVALITALGEIPVKDDTELIRLLPADNFLLAHYDAARGQLMDFTWLIAAWITRAEPTLCAIRDQALGLEPAVGEKVARGPSAAGETRRRVTAIYSALKERNIIYNDDNLVFHAEEDDYVQRVQYPKATLEEASGNCLDASVLFASLLSICGIDPVILLIPHHALVGWLIPGATDNPWEFIEPTVISKAHFDVALSLGAGKYAKCQQRVRRIDGGTSGVIDDVEAFALAIDIHEVLRVRRVLSGRVEDEKPV